jgi:nitroimidazol reductase NimA-like FMN-containing flavoprotein (pyridoxamine 5'-phosphate oxidase superfamily)
MTPQLPAGTEDIPAEKCWELLAQQQVGRLAVVHQGEPDIFPVSYVVDHGGIVFRTGAGTKLAAARSHPVALEVDGLDDANAIHWSVVLKGQASRLEGVKAVLQDEFARLVPVQSGPKPWLMRIDPVSVTGRRLRGRSDSRDSTGPTTATQDPA